LYLTTQWRLGDMQPLRRTGEIALLGNGHEIAKVSQLHLYTSRI
jgi:hypothetical protein